MRRFWESLWGRTHLTEQWVSAVDLAVAAFVGPATLVRASFKWFELHRSSEDDNSTLFVSFCARRVQPELSNPS